MNQNEFEKWLKDKIESARFEGNEADWEKLQSRMDRQRPIIRKKVWYTSISVRLAAGILIPVAVISALIVSLYDGDEIQRSSVEVSDRSVHITDKGQSSDSIDSDLAVVPLSEDRDNAGRKPLRKIEGTAKGESRGLSDTGVSDVQHYASESGESRNEKKDMSQTVVQPDGLKEYSSDIPAFTEKYSNRVRPDLYTAERKHDNAYNLLAGVGSQNVGAVQYHVGFSGQFALTEMLFLDAAVGLNTSQTQINYSRHIQGMEVKSDIGSGTNSYYESGRNINAAYYNQVYSLGVFPAIGVHLTKKVSVSAGGYTYRHITTSLDLDNQDMKIDNAFIEGNLIPQQSAVNMWEAGVTGSLEYTLYRSVRIHLRYHHGLTDYIHIKNQSYRSSGILLGVKYKLNK